MSNIEKNLKSRWKHSSAQGNLANNQHPPKTACNDRTGVTSSAEPHSPVEKELHSWLDDYMLNKDNDINCTNLEKINRTMKSLKVAQVRL